MAYQIKISIMEIQPAFWIRIIIPGLRIGTESIVTIKVKPEDKKY